MKDIQKAINEYQKLDFNKKINIVHSIDIDSYKILCKKFFTEKYNRVNFLRFANENLLFDNESEKKFTRWLNVEWYDKKGRNIFCWFKPCCG